MKQEQKIHKNSERVYTTNTNKQQQNGNNRQKQFQLCIQTQLKTMQYDIGMTYITAKT